MNFYYDLVLNFLDTNYLFYDWDEFDNIEYIKKIPIFQVTSKSFKEMYQYNGKVTLEFLKELEDKTILKKDKLKYACIIADKNNAMALEFASDGNIIARSSLMLKDEISLLEYLYTIPISDIEFVKEQVLKINNDIRKCQKIKKFIMTELKRLEEENNIAKLKFLYLEWFNEKEDDLTKIKQRMTKRLAKGINEEEIHIYNIIKLSYNNV